MSTILAERPHIDVNEKLLKPAASAIDDGQNEPSEMDEDLQREILSKIRKVNQQGKSNRMAEVQNGRDQRLYFRGIQQFYWSEDRQDVIFETEDDDSPYTRTFNTYQGYGKIFMSTFLGAKPKVRAEADDPFDAAAVRNTSKANTYQRIYRKRNDVADQQLQIARLMWTDGRIISRIEKNDKDEEITELFGTLESRVSISANCLKECLLIELEKDLPTATLKAECKDDATKKKINSGNGDSYERNARIAVRRQAGSDTAIDVQTGQDSYGLSTKTWSYMRPEFYQEFSDEVSQQLLSEYPAGLCFIHTGDVYLDAYEYDIDAHLDVLHAMPGDGMSKPSIGSSMMPLQDSINTSMNLIEETFDHGIPTTYYNTETNIDGLNKQKNLPGSSRKMTLPKGTTAGSHFFETQVVNPSAQLLSYAENLRGPIAQFATGQMPASFGADMPDQKTAHGYAQARNMALGQMAIVWKPFTSWYTRENTRAVKLASSGQNEISSYLNPNTPGGKAEAVRIIPGELQNMSYTNESDENFPETWTEKSNKFMGLLQLGGPVADAILDEEPDNLYMMKNMFGLQELVIPGEELRNNVLADIAQLESEPDTPDPTQMPEQSFPQMGAPPVQPPLVSPITIDTDWLEPKDFAIGYKTVKQWITSSKGQDAKAGNPPYFARVKLYGLQYKRGMDAANQPPPVPPPPTMGISASWKDLPPDAQVEALQRDGYNVNPATVGANKQVVKTSVPGAP